MSNDNSVIRSISWRDLCPWLVIFRGFSLALNPNIILLAFAGVILSYFAWFMGDVLFLKTVRVEAEKEKLVELQQVFDANVSPLRRAANAPFDGDPNPTDAIGIKANKGVPGVFWDYAGSFRYIFDFSASSKLSTGNRLALLAYFLFGGLATIAIWSILAGAITRIAVMRLGREEGCSLVDAVKFSLERFLAYFLGPVMPMAFVLIVALIVGFCCLPMLWDWGVVLVGIFWFLVLLAGFLMAFLLIGLLFGWPLMWPTISAESSDAFDSISRCYAYVMQRPLSYLFYVFVCMIFGAFCWWIVMLFGEQVIAMSDWAASWGARANRLTEIHAVAADDGEVLVAALDTDAATDGGLTTDTATDTGTDADVETGPSGTLKTGSNIIAFWNGILRTLVAAYAYGLFWCLSSAVYLLLRKDVDETEFDEIYVEGEDDYGLPPITSEPSPSAATDTKATSGDKEDVATVSSDKMKKRDTSEKSSDDKSGDNKIGDEKDSDEA